MRPSKDGVSHLSSKAFHVVLLSVEGIFCDKKGKVGVLDTQLLDALVKEISDLLPNGEGVGTKDVAACTAPKAKVKLDALASIAASLFRAAI